MKRALGWRIDESLKQNVKDEAESEKRKPAAHLEHILENHFASKNEHQHQPKNERK